MKVLIPVKNDSDEKYEVLNGFQNADWVCIYDCDQKIYSWLKADEIANDAGNLSLELKSRGVFSVITMTIPLLALDLFTDSGLKVYRASGENLIENIDLYLRNDLEPFSSQTESMMQSCSSSCNSCSGNC